MLDYDFIEELEDLNETFGIETPEFESEEEY